MIYPNLETTDVTPTSFSVKFDPILEEGFWHTAIKLMNMKTKQIVTPKATNEVVFKQFSKYNVGEPLSWYFDLEPGTEYKVYLTSMDLRGFYTVPYTFLQCTDELLEQEPPQEENTNISETSNKPSFICRILSYIWNLIFN